MTATVTSLPVSQANVTERINAALAAKFIRTEQIGRIISLAVASGKNILLWGPGGHGKSEMVEAALRAVAAESDIFVQSFGEGMDEATLWGGLDFRALETDKVLRYFPENSFLAKPYGVFEEIFDAPASVLLALKDTLTAKRLRKGAQQYPMTTKVVIAITNKDPSEIADLGPAAAALIERFPLQLKVEWPSYTAADYSELFAKVGPGLPGADLNGTGGVLAELLAKASGNGDIISPRTAIHALGVVKAAAALRGASHVEKQDLVDLTFLPGMEAFAATIRGELDAAYTRAAAEDELRELIQGLSEESPIKLLQAAKRLEAFGDRAANLVVTDGLTDRRRRLRETVGAKAEEAKRLALEKIRI